MERQLEGDHNRPMPRNHMISKLCAVAILCSGEGLLAEAIYKQTDATGVITFTDRPTAHDVIEPYVRLSSQPGGSISVERPVNGNRLDVAAALTRNAAMSSTYAAAIDFNEARLRLKRARKNRQEGIEPRSGERADSSSTGPMNKRYQSRQRGLQREVVAAERRWHETSLVQSTRVLAFLSRDAPRP